MRASGGAAAAISSVVKTAGEQRSERGDRERDAGAPLLRHGVAVEAGDDGGRLARDLDQDRGGRAAVLRAVEHAGEHDERADRIELEGDRQQHRHGRKRADARQHADHGADQAPEEAESRDSSRSARRRSPSRGCREGRACQDQRGQSAIGIPEARTKMPTLTTTRAAASSSTGTRSRATGRRALASRTVTTSVRHETNRLEQDGERGAGQGDEDERPPIPSGRPLARAQHGNGCKHQAEDQQDERDDRREVAGAHRACGPLVEASAEPQARGAEGREHEPGEEVLAH